MIKKAFLICFLLCAKPGLAQSFIDISLEEKIRYSLNIKTVEFNNEYKNNPINTELFNISIPYIQKFFNEISPTSTNENLSTSYIHNITVENSQQSLCAITVKLKENIINNYMSLSHFSEDEAITYLIDHEFSHCLVSHFNLNLNDKENENFSDLMAILKSELTENTKLTAKIIYNNKKLPDDYLHKNPILFEKFFEYLHENDFLVKNISIQEQINIVLSFLKSNPN